MTEWLVLLHHLPPKPDYFRAKVRRRLQRLGAVPIKNSAYVLPDNAETAEDFQWLLQEIVDGGGEAIVLGARLVAGITDDELIQRFKAASDAAYDAIVAESLSEKDAPRSDRPRLRARIDEVARTDFFQAEGRARAERTVAEASTPVNVPDDHGVASSTLSGRTWVTRRGVFVDRMATAWFVRRFIDAGARFRFIDDPREPREAGEIRFDMQGAEFTHHGDSCTFESIAARCAPDDPAITAIGELVHDIDLKDEKFGRPEVEGVTAILRGIARANGDDDEARIVLASKVFDGLYESYRT